MNKKHLIAAFIIAALSTVGAQASNISGVTPTGHTYNINPAQQHGSVGYRAYENFQLTKGDIANLIFKYGEKNVNTFINMVNNQANINGIVNTVRDGKFNNGHAVFISPKGLVVGSSGVLNVGSLSVITPSANKYKNLLSDYDKHDYTVINNLSQLKKDSNAAIDVQGKIFARNGVDLRGTNMNVSGTIINGLKDTSVMTSLTQANELFKNLVNTDGLMVADNFVNNGSAVVIKNSDKTGAGINVTGRVANFSGGETALTNHGAKGLTVKGVLDTNGKLNLYNNNSKSAMNVGGRINTVNNSFSANNQGTDMNFDDTTKITVDKDIEIVNNGTGNTKIEGIVFSSGDTTIANQTKKGNMVLDAKIGHAINTNSVTVLNRAGKLSQVGGNLGANKEVKVLNDGNGGMNLDATIGSQKLVRIYNKNGDLSLNGRTGVSKGNIEIWNTENGKSLTIGKKAEVIDHGHLAVKNEGKGGLTIDGTLSNSVGNAKTAINNTNGDMVINGTILNTGNMGIINKDKGSSITFSKDSKVINSVGKLKLVNTSGKEMNINGLVRNSGGSTYVYNDEGQLNIAGTVENLSGNTYIASRANSTGITTTEKSNISNKSGVLAIKNYGKNGMNLNGSISNATGQVTGLSGDTAINNYKGDMLIGGTVSAKGNMGIINRAGGANMVSNARITNTNKNATTNIKNNGLGNMTIGGTINHYGRVNVLANEGNLNLNSKVQNNGGFFYAAARANGDGVNVSKDFEATSTKGDILIRNITGKNGMTYDGKITNKGGQAAIVNKVGNMYVNGTVSNTNGVVIVSNSGNKLTTGKNSVLSSNKEVKVVNRGSSQASLNGTVKAPSNTKWFYEKVTK